MIRKKIIFCSFNENNMQTGMLNVPNSDDRDEYLKNKSIINQVARNINPKVILIQNKIPTQVATPLPPLNFNHKGKT